MIRLSLISALFISLFSSLSVEAADGFVLNRRYIDEKNKETNLTVRFTPQTVKVETLGRNNVDVLDFTPEELAPVVTAAQNMIKKHQAGRERLKSFNPYAEDLHLEDRLGQGQQTTLLQLSNSRYHVYNSGGDTEVLIGFLNVIQRATKD